MLFSHPTFAIYTCKLDPAQHESASDAILCLPAPRGVLSRLRAFLKALASLRKIEAVSFVFDELHSSFLRRNYLDR